MPGFFVNKGVYVILSGYGDFSVPRSVYRFSSVSAKIEVLPIKKRAAIIVFSSVSIINIRNSDTFSPGSVSLHRTEQGNKCLYPRSF